MNNHELMIRMAELKDAEEILEIYAPYVTDTAITFDYEVPTLEEFQGRMINTMKMYPYLVAVYEGKIVGYCYVSQFKNKDAYDWSVESTVYVRRDFKGKGTGRTLYAKLEEILKMQHILNVNACITYPHTESIAFHEKLGYQTVAHFHQCGYKLGVWHDMVWMEKMLGEHGKDPQPVIPIGDLDVKEIAARLQKS